MCGFLVMIDRPDAADFEPALQTLTPRGPDAQGLWVREGAQLGHRRLAVIDLAGGVQPMSSEDGRHHLVYNGEIYNFRELRARLEALGRRFHTRSDTEVLLQAFVQWGPDCLKELDGIFAFALWDSLERKLLVARDRVGAKPLYYSAGPNGFACASTLHPFFKLSAQDRRINYAAVRDYLAQAFFSDPHSILATVNSLEPGMFLRWDARQKSLETKRYWEIPPATQSPMSLDELVEATDAALRESVRRQLVADVDVGLFFSGGIDSSLLAYYMGEVSGRPARTFTVKFDQSPRHDEAPIAARVAKALGTTHQECRAGAIGAEEFARAVEAMDQPFGDSSYIPVLQMSRLAREHVTVVLGGDGGDELFAGYPRYLRGAGAYPPTPAHALIRRGVEAGLLPSSLHRGSLRGRDRVIRHFSRMHAFPGSSRDVASILSPGAIDLCRPDLALQQWIDSVLRWTGEMDSDSLVRTDLWYYLAQNCLVKTDRASMSFGLEARVPFLGNPVLDLVLPQPASVKLAEGLKSVLQRLARRYLPADCWDRPKRGFTVPEAIYLTRTWRPYCDELFAQCEELAPFLNASEVRRRWAREVAGRHVDWPLYGVVCLLGWLRTHRLTF